MPIWAHQTRWRRIDVCNGLSHKFKNPLAPGEPSTNVMQADLLMSSRPCRPPDGARHSPRFALLLPRYACRLHGCCLPLPIHIRACRHANDRGAGLKVLNLRSRSRAKATTVTRREMPRPLNRQASHSYRRNTVSRFSRATDSRPN